MQICYSILLLHLLKVSTVFLQRNEATKLSDLFKLPSNFNGKSSMVTSTGTTTLHSSCNKKFEFQSSLNTSGVNFPYCPGLKDAAVYTSTELIEALTAPCRYDRTQRPLVASADGSGPVKVYTRAFVNGVHYTAPNSNKLKAQLILKVRYVDHRLSYAQYAPNHTQPIQGGSEVYKLLWLPQLVLTNRQESSVLSRTQRNVITSIGPDGMVILVFNIPLTFNCVRKLKSFPHNEIFCTISIDSLLYDSDDLVLCWEQLSPITLNHNFQLLGYELQGIWMNASIIAKQADTPMTWNEYAPFDYTRSSISFTLVFLSAGGSCLMEYFIPSMLIVAASWVSFWIRADQTPSRTIFGCHTMVSLITLTGKQFKNPTGFDTVFEVWFLCCVLFIFGSLVEFAFSNTVLRRKRNVEFKKFSGKSILKSTVMPRKNHRKSIYQGFEKIDQISCLTDSPVVMTNCVRFNMDCVEIIEKYSSDGEQCDDSAKRKQLFESMTPEEVSIWLDRKARLVFPLAFVVFNCFFWLFVTVL